MSILDLFSSQSTGRLSHTKLWTNIAYAVASAVVILQNYLDSRQNLKRRTEAGS